MGWWRVLVETWWWVLCGVALGAVAARQFLRRPALPVDTHPAFLEVRAEVQAQRSRADELAEARAAVEQDRRDLVAERDALARQVRELEAELRQPRRRASLAAPESPSDDEASGAG